MNGFIKWFDSKSKLKRWMLLILIGIALICYGTAEILVLKEMSFAQLAKIIVTFVIGVLAIIFAIVAGAIAKNSDKALLVQMAGILVVVGHTYPVFFGFKGGKGVATSLGVLLMTNWKIGLICLVFALVLMALTRIVSMGSVGAAILFPVLTLFIHTNYTISEGSSYLVYSIILALIVAFNHRSNIRRILNGTENKLSFKK